ncbi:glycoside hydrolase family 10 protein [Kaistella montana]|uniref:Glycoside hydrolase family 10 protein n=1 Tax=Kaistella montana TaxID=1849733 RepID=A0ABW5K9N8_9FLAO|nr:family 10 glycosylhydrolase [Kaistella montana]MCQ4034787.1 family 10 glycosylhydrolase [Kaistella montana]
MNHRNLLYPLLVATAIFINSCTNQKPSKSVTKKPTTTVKPTTPKPSTSLPDSENKTIVNLPEINREFRAAWIATVANINWPSKNTLTTQQQKDEAIQLLDLLKNANFNAVIFQVRPSADAMYKSDLEPWSYFLTGETGKAPSPYYDPLEFWIAEAHKRGMELHVWMNPYRAHHTTGGSVNSSSMASRMSESTYRLRNGMYWMDPSDARVQNHVSAVVKDLVKRYDIDAVHIDDYFYPYKEYHGGKDFPDDRTWNQYKNAGGTLSRADWRRANVNKIIKRLHDEIHQEKPTVKFGISPFGIWKPGFPAGVTGSSQYDELYADAKLWLNEGWCDYYAPQLYWKEGGAQSFSALLKWWKDENFKNIHLWPGLNTVAIKSDNKQAEITGQMNSIRRMMPKNTAGEIHYSIDGIRKNPEMLKEVKKLYSENALVPTSPWIKTTKPATPNISVEKSSESYRISWNSKEKEKVFRWVLYAKYGDNWVTEILNREQLSKNIPATQNGKKLNTVAVKAIDRLSNESDYDAEKL